MTNIKNPLYIVYRDGSSVGTYYADHAARRAAEEEAARHPDKPIYVLQAIECYVKPTSPVVKHDLKQPTITPIMDFRPAKHPFTPVYSPYKWDY